MGGGGLANLFQRNTETGAALWEGLSCFNSPHHIPPLSNAHQLDVF